MLKEKIVEFLNYLGIFESPEKAWEVSARLRSSPDVTALVKALNGLDEDIREACRLDSMFDPHCEMDVKFGVQYMRKAVNMLLIRQMLRMAGEPEENITPGLLLSFYDRVVRYGEIIGQRSLYGRTVAKKINRYMKKWVFGFGRKRQGTLIEAFHLTVFSTGTLQEQAEYLLNFDEEKQTELILSMDDGD